MPPRDDQKRYDRFMELVKKVYAGSDKNKEVYKIEQNLWRKVNTDEAEYKRVFNDLIACSAREKRNTITFWTEQAEKRFPSADVQKKEDTQSKPEAQNTSEANTSVEGEEKSSNSAEGNTPTKVVIIDDEDQRDTPAQDRKRSVISKLKVQIASLMQLREHRHVNGYCAGNKG